VGKENGTARLLAMFKESEITAQPTRLGISSLGSVNQMRLRTSFQHKFGGKCLINAAIIEVPGMPCMTGMPLMGD